MAIKNIFHRDFLGALPLFSNRHSKPIIPSEPVPPPTTTTMSSDPTTNTTASSVKPRSVAIILCSTRTPRVGPSISSFVTTQLTSLLPSSTIPTTLETIDLAIWDLPIFNESIVPSQLSATDPTPGYDRPLTRAWSAEIRKHDAFVFVTPQYNWSIPASLKNAIDYLYHEWAGKPGMIVSYGGRGGGRAAGHLAQVLMGVRMKPVGVMTELALGKGVYSAGREGKLDDGQETGWLEGGVPESLKAAWAELNALLDAKTATE